MKNEKLVQILEGLLILVVGILIAVFGIQTVVDTYFGILFLVGGVALFIVELVNLVKVGKLTFAGLFSGAAASALGACLLAGYISFGVLVNIIVVLIIAFGFALLVYGVYAVVKVNKGYGIGQIIIGALAALMGVLYITFPGFRTAFWIVVGILIALYGGFVFFYALLSKKK